MSYCKYLSKKVLTISYFVGNLIIVLIIGINMKYSKQREMIKNTLDSNRIHPTAETLYTILKNEGQNISLATVYRNLNNLAEAGIIRKFKTAEKTDRFDSTMMPHYHFLCKECGIVYDLPIEISKDVESNVSKYGYKVTEYDMMLSGICPKCQTKGEKNGFKRFKN